MLDRRALLRPRLGHDLIERRRHGSGQWRNSSEAGSTKRVHQKNRRLHRVVGPAPCLRVRLGRKRPRLIKDRLRVLLQLIKVAPERFDFPLRIQ